jgi:hypothetical protein
MLRVAICAKRMSPSATPHVTIIEFVMGKRPMTGSVGAQISTAWAVNPSPSCFASPADATSLLSGFVDRKSALHTGIAVPISNNHSEMIRIVRISRKNPLQGTPRPLSKKADVRAGSPKKLHHREKFHKRFLKKI